MCNLGLFSFMKQAGSVHLHEQGTLSSKRYDELKCAQKMIKKFMGDTNYRVDIYDANTVPADKFVYTKEPDSVYMEVKDLLNDSVSTAEFFEKNDEPMLRRIFKFVDKSLGVESPIESMKKCTRSRLQFRKKSNNKEIRAVA